MMSKICKNSCDTSKIPDSIIDKTIKIAAHGIFEILVEIENHCIIL